jgi:DNA repair protein RecO (recombination protein O)
MKQRYQNITAYVLHTRKYRDTSLLIEFFSDQLGRCSAVAKGVYQGKSPKRNLLQPFVPLQLNLQGSTELLSLTSVEMCGAPNYYQGQILACGLYLNELVSYTLHRYDAHPQLFVAYQQALTALNKNAQCVLREFELDLLDELGYGIDLRNDDSAVEYYHFEAGKGFVPVITAVESRYSFSRQIIQNILHRNWQEAETLRAAKYLTRTALAPLLAGKAILSRELLKS